MEMTDKLKTYNGEPGYSDGMADLDEKEVRDLFVRARISQLDHKDYSEVEFIKIGGEKHEKKSIVPRSQQPQEGGQGELAPQGQ
jgi:hypothetical protein